MDFRQVKKVLWIILFMNLAVALIKIIVGKWINSASMTADGFHSLTDGSSNIVGIIGITLASKPTDEDHPYGHRKYETLSALVIAGMLFIIGVNVSLGAINKFIHPTDVSVTYESLIMLLLTLVINIFVTKYEHKRGIELKSQILVSDAMHTKSDIFVTIGVLTTLIGIKLGLPNTIDPIASLVVAGFIFRAGYEIFKETSRVLLDEAAIDKDKIRELVLEFEKVKNVHDIRSRGNENEIFIDMHLMTEPNMSVEESHNLSHDIEEKMRNDINENIHLITHIEPYTKTEETV